MPKRSRTERREAERAAAKLAQARIKLAALEEGGAPNRPIEVASASVVEPHASSLPCAACGAQGVRIEEHVAITVGESRLRVARVRCQQCSVRREIYFRIGTTLPS